MFIQMNRRELVEFLAPVAALMAFGLIIPLALIVYNSLGDGHLSLDAYVALFNSRLFLGVARATVEISLTSTAVSLLLGYPIALQLSRLSNRWRPIFLIFVLLPFWTSISVKSYSFIVVLGEQGLVNNALAAVGLPHIAMVFSRVGVVVGLSNFLVPFVVFPLLSNFLAQSADLRKTAAAMGRFGPLHFLADHVSAERARRSCWRNHVLGYFAWILGHAGPARGAARYDDCEPHRLLHAGGLDWATASAIAVLLFMAGAALLLVLGKLRGKKVLI
ncbi:ABC transporter permease [Bradyrhizobium cenepequi]|uniref:ABC transporter permease n=1 Tax=Bradyrhizobium cenepequi TaxID=2821403 RepID=UPI001CE2E13A|nr:hypothetical protein [Bradyrhizobium cenepequi]MCA6112597.1 hypothetical protein [Bradyrhizobium cenepequi]